MEQTLRHMVAKIAETSSDFADGASLRNELKLDSVRAFELVFEIERTFDLKFPEERYREIDTFTDLVRVVRSLRAA